MNQIRLSNCSVLAACLWLGFAAAPAAAGEQNLASEVRSVFAAKCAGCHGPNLARPRGRFGYVLDLARVAGNPEMVVPSTPDESELWELVRRGEMPPEDSPTGPLTEQQKETIHDWIKAGAPAESTRTESTEAEPVSSVAADPAETSQASAPPSLIKSVLRRVGPFHLVVVHFPIALLIAAAVAEFWSIIVRSRVPAPSVRFCVLLGAVSAMAAASFGWIHAANGHGLGAPQILGLHRLIGTTAAGWAVAALFISERDERCGVRSLWFRIWLFLGALLVAAAGHFGGTLVHGDG